MQFLKLLPLIGISTGLLTYNCNMPASHKAAESVHVKTARQPGPGGFTLKGQLAAKHDAPSFIHLYYTNSEGGYEHDSCTFNKGTFEFKGMVAKPELATIIIKSNNMPTRDGTRQVWLEGGTDINLKSEGQLHSSVISGSELNMDQQKLDAIMQPFLDKMEASLMAYRKALKTPGEAAAKKKYNVEDKKLTAEKEAATMKFVRDHPDSYIGLEELSYRTSDPNISHADFKAMYDGLSDKVKATEEGKTIGLFVKNRDVVVVGTMAPVFTQNDVKGKPVNLSSLHGKYVLIDFWASWCMPCRAENPDVVKAYNKYKGKGFTILGVSLDDKNSKAAWLQAIKTDKLTWTHVCDMKGWNNEAAGLYAVRAVPANFLIDPNGKIIAKDLHGAALETALAKFVK